MSRKLPIFYSALLLTCVNLLLRLVGTSFQVYLSGRIGAEGIGLLQLVLSVGSMALVAGMAGIRTATMYLSAEQVGKRTQQNNRWVLSGCLLYSILASTAIGISLYIFAPIIAEKWIGNPQTFTALRLISLLLPINCLTGVMVGYFTGVSRIGTLAVVEIAEQAFTMVCTMVLLNVWAGSDPQRSCLAVIFGSGMGACLTLCALTFLRIREHAPKSQLYHCRKQLLKTAMPLALADNLRTGISTVENLMVPKRLALFPGVTSPLAAFGTVCGMVFPILTFPIAILFGLTELLIPELARCNAAGSRERINYLMHKSLRVALLFSALCGGVIYLCADNLCIKLYNSIDAGRYLRWFAPLAPLLYCDSITDAMIKGLGQQKISVRYNIFTNILDVAFLFVLLPRYGIAGYFASFLVTHIINFLLSMRRLLIITGEKINIITTLLTLSSAAACTWAAWHLASPIGRAIAYSILLICMLFLLKVLSREDIRWIKGLIRKK